MAALIAVPVLSVQTNATVLSDTSGMATEEAPSKRIEKGIRFSALTSAHDALLQMPVSIHPDYACIKLSQDSGLWRNMVGQTFGFIKAESGQWIASTAISGFVELHDLIGQFMSWQMWRGNLGANLYLEHLYLNRRFPLKSKLVLQIGWNHESQHVSDMKSFIKEYTNLPHPDSFNNATVRSFEYISLQLHYLLRTNNEKWSIIIRPGYRYFPGPIMIDAGRHQKYALSFEAGIHRRVRKLWEVYLHGFYERITNDYVNTGYPYKIPWNKQPLLYRQVEAGLAFSYNKKQCDIFMRFSHSNGRGLDYLRSMKWLGGGFRFVL